MLVWAETGKSEGGTNGIAEVRKGREMRRWVSRRDKSCISTNKLKRGNDFQIRMLESSKGCDGEYVRKK